MPLLDVSDILLDPDFMDAMTCTRFALATSSAGMGSRTSTTSTFYGVETSDSGDSIDRLSTTGERVKGSITVHTTFRLLDGRGAAQTADEVTFRGAVYTVSKVNDYSHFGRGFVVATCDLKPLMG